MTIFEFINNNKSKVSELIDCIIEEKIISIEPNDFDFTCSDISFEVDEGVISFTVELEDMTITTSVDTSSLAENMQYIKKISDFSLRENVILAIEDHFLSTLTDQLENVEATLTEAQGEHDIVVKEESDVKSSLRSIKDEWGIL